MLKNATADQILMILSIVKTCKCAYLLTFPLCLTWGGKGYKQTLSIPRFIAMHVSFPVGNFFHYVHILSLNEFCVVFLILGTAFILLFRQ